MLCWNYDLDPNAIMQMMRLALRSPVGRMPRARLVPPLASAGALLLLSFFWKQWMRRPWDGSFSSALWYGFYILFTVLYVLGAWRTAREGILRLEMKAMRKLMQTAPMPGTHRVTVCEGVYTHEGDLGSGTAQTIQYMKEEIRCVTAGKAGLLVVFTGDGFDFIPAHAFPAGETPRSSRRHLLAALAGEAVPDAADASARAMPQGTREVFSAETAYAERTCWTYRIERGEVGQLQDEVWKALRGSWKYWKRMWPFCIFMLLFAAQLGRMLIGAALDGNWVFLIMTVLMFSLWLCGVRAIVRRQRAHSDPRFDLYSGDYTLRLGPAAFVVEKEGNFEQVPYAGVCEWYETEHYFYMVYRPQRTVMRGVTIPKHAFTAAEQTELCRQLRARCSGMRG